MIKKYQIIFLLFFFLSKEALADDAGTQFNFDESYQGEEFVTEETLAIYDPLESINRPIFVFNEGLDKYVALPVARQYHRFVPEVIKKSVHNFTTNLSAPFSIINSILQGDGENSMASFSSFLINTTVGIGGLFDVAGSKKIQYNDEDLGQTLGKYGMGSGPYLVIPIMGPSSVRDFTGLAVEKAFDPLAFNMLKVGGERELINDEVSIGLFTLKAVDTREGLINVIDNIRKDSFDVYATFRSAYLQRRNSLILNKVN